jgi:hypothetical protein
MEGLDRWFWAGYYSDPFAIMRVGAPLEKDERLA